LSCSVELLKTFHRTRLMLLGWMSIP